MYLIIINSGKVAGSFLRKIDKEAFSFIHGFSYSVLDFGSKSFELVLKHVNELNENLYIKYLLTVLVNKQCIIHLEIKKLLGVEVCFCVSFHSVFIKDNYWIILKLVFFLQGFLLFHFFFMNLVV